MTDSEHKPKTETTTETENVPLSSFDTALPKAVVETLKPLLEDVSVENLMRIIPELIRHVEMYKNFTGEQKRNMVINMLKHLIDITDGPGNDEIFDPILKRMVPSIIDTLVEVDKGRLKLTGKKLKKLPCFTLFKGCMSSCKGGCSGCCC